MHTHSACNCIHLRRHLRSHEPMHTFRHRFSGAASPAPPLRCCCSLFSSGDGRRYFEGYWHLCLAMHIAQHQAKVPESYYIFEHPAPALSWQQDVTQDIPGSRSAVFDQCMLGLKDPDGRPLKKRTKVMSNLLPLLSELVHWPADLAQDTR